MQTLETFGQTPERVKPLSLNIVKGREGNVQHLGLPYTMNHVGSMFSLFFTDQKVVDFETAKTSNTEAFGRYFLNMLERGVYLAPSQFESLFVSTAITDDLVDAIVTSNYESLKAL